MAVTLAELRLADQAAAWERCGFRVEDGSCLVGDVRIRFVTPQEGRGLVGWSLAGVGSTDLDGLATERSDSGPVAPAPPHPNGVAALDHVVAISSDLDRSVRALEAAGLDLRRVREEPTPAGAPRQAFFRLGSALLELVQEPTEATARAGGDRPAFFWGLAFTVPTIEASADYLGERAGEARPAVQPGRRILSLRRAAGLAVPVALITPPPPRGVAAPGSG